MLTASETPADTTLADAREAVAYWRARHSKLSWHRRAARREARTMTARWRARLIRAHLERLGLGALAVLLEPLIALLGRSRREHVGWLWRVVGRRTPLASRRLWLTMAIVSASVATLGILAAHAAWVAVL